MAKREPAQRERGTGRVYQQRDPQHPERTLQVWWLDYSVHGRRYRESSKSRKRSDAVKLLKQRLGQTPEQGVGPSAEADLRRSRSGHRGRVPA